MTDKNRALAKSMTFASRHMMSASLPDSLKRMLLTRRSHGVKALFEAAKRAEEASRTLGIQARFAAASLAPHGAIEADLLWDERVHDVLRAVDMFVQGTSAGKSRSLKAIDELAPVDWRKIFPSLDKLPVYRPKEPSDHMKRGAVEQAQRERNIYQGADSLELLKKHRRLRRLPGRWRVPWT